MRRYVVSGILLILPIIFFAVAAPVPPVQKKSQADVVDVVHIVREDAPIPMLEKRGDPLDKMKFVLDEVHFAKPPRVPPLRLSSLEPPPDPEPPREFGYEAMMVHAPLSTPVFPTWFHPAHADNGMMGAHASLPKLGSSDLSTNVDSGQRLVVEEPSRPPPPTKGSESSTKSSLQ
jgi:hypothetical protein